MTTETSIIAVWAEGFNKPADPLQPKSRIMGNSDTNSMPWPRSHADLEQFTRDTAEHVLIMGRKTFESLPKSMTEGMPGRVTTQHRPMIVLTHDAAWAFARQVMASENGLDIAFGGFGNGFTSPQTAVPARVLAYARSHYPDKSIAVVGGPEVIELFEPYYDRLLITWHYSLEGWEGGDVRAPFTMRELGHAWTITLRRALSSALHQYTYVPTESLGPDVLDGLYAGNTAGGTL